MGDFRSQTEYRSYAAMVAESERMLRNQFPTIHERLEKMAVEAALRRDYRWADYWENKRWGTRCPSIKDRPNFKRRRPC